MPDPKFEDFLRRVDELQSRWNFVRKGMVELMTTMKEQPKIMWPPLHPLPPCFGVCSCVWE